jgi:hypothetical protein
LPAAGGPGALGPPGALGEASERAWALRGALELTTGRNSTCCSREQIGQFWIRWL